MRRAPTYRNSDILALHEEASMLGPSLMNSAMASACWSLQKKASRVLLSTTSENDSWIAGRRPWRLRIEEARCPCMQSLWATVQNEFDNCMWAWWKRDSASGIVCWSAIQVCIGYDKLLTPSAQHENSRLAVPKKETSKFKN